MNGYAGKILRINLTLTKISMIPTKNYIQWVGGHGIGSALFWDLVKDKRISGFDPGNVVTIMTSPLTGTLAPSTGRTEVQGIGVQSSPIEWFTRSNFGGRFGTMLKFAGWDGIVVEGRASKPVWVDIRNEQVAIKGADHLWGQDSWQTQKMIWEEVSGQKRGGEFWELMEDGRYTTQKPAVLAIGQAGEMLSRMACLIHDAGNAAGQGGFGAVWGSKNLKAISVIGTGSISVANPKALMEARNWARKNFQKGVSDPESMETAVKTAQTFGIPPHPIHFWKQKKGRPQACAGCMAGCRMRTDSGHGNESSCIVSYFYTQFDLYRNSGLFVNSLSSLFKYFGQGFNSEGIRYLIGKHSEASYLAADMTQKYGINAYELSKGLPYLRDLYKMGVLGQGKAIDCDLPFDKIGSLEFIEKFFESVIQRKGIGDDIAEGFFRAAEKWGRLEDDLRSGLLEYPYWGLPGHGYDPRAEVEWGYGSILGDRDINEHDFNVLFWLPTAAMWDEKEPILSAEEATRIVAEKLEPFEGNPLMLDYSSENLYSEHMAKLVSWHRRYTRFWKQSVLYCDLRFPDFWNTNTPDMRGITGVGEQKFLNAVTGLNLTFADGIDLGRRIWNLDNAIWTLQGRHRDMVRFSDYLYDVDYAGKGMYSDFLLPGLEDGRWKYIKVNNRRLDRNKFEAWKSKYYQHEGWDQQTGWPTKETLKAMDMEFVADELEKHNKLGVRHEQAVDTTA